MPAPKRANSAPTATTSPTPDQGEGEISVVYVPLSEVNRWHRNPKRHDLPTLMDSIRRFGFAQPICRDGKTGKLVAGHGRLEALLKLHSLGQPAPKRIRVNAAGEWCVPVLSGIAFDTEEEAEAFLLADNRISQIGGWDQQELDAILADLDDLSGVGFELTAAELDDAEREANAAAAQASAFEEPNTSPAPVPFIVPPRSPAFADGPAWGPGAGADNSLGRSLGGASLGASPAPRPFPQPEQPAAVQGPRTIGTAMYEAATAPDAPPPLVWQPNPARAKMNDNDSIFGANAAAADPTSKERAELTSFSVDRTVLPHVHFKIGINVNRIPVTPTELDMLQNALDHHVDATGSMHGFFRRVLGLLPETETVPLKGGTPRAEAAEVDVDDADTDANEDPDAAGDEDEE